MKPIAAPRAAPLAVLLALAGPAGAQDPGSAPIPIDPQLPRSERMALSEIHRHQQGTSPTFSERKVWGYVHGVVLTAIEQVGRRTGNPLYLDYVKSYGDQMVGEDGAIEDYAVGEYNLDNINPANVLFDLLDRTGEARYRAALARVRSQLDGQPRVYLGGFWHKQIYTNQMWLDGLYMAQPFRANYERRWGDPEAFEDIARQFMVMERQARDPTTGLLYHGWDCSREMFWADKITGLSSSFWGRAIGWYAMGLVDTLDHFPADHPRRPELIAILNRTVDAMTAVQDEAGVWWQVLDMPGREGNYPEATVSTMMTYVLLKGVRMGYLDRSRLDAAARAWRGLFAVFVTVDPDDHEMHLAHCCSVSGLGGKGTRRDGTFAYYISEPVRANDGKGTGPFIRACIEVETMPEWLPDGAAEWRERFEVAEKAR